MKKAIVLGLLFVQMASCGDDVLVVTTVILPTGEPDAIELGERLATSVTSLNLEGLSASEISQVYLGSTW